MTMSGRRASSPAARTSSTTSAVSSTRRSRVSGMPEPTVVWDARAVLGEGPIWDERERVLHWVDVEASTLHTLEPASGRRTSRTLPGRCSSVGLRENGGLLVAHDRSVSLLEGDDELVSFAPGLSRKAWTNDGAVDPRGRYLIGTVRPEDEPWTAALYRVDPDGSVEQLEKGLDISNGIDWSLDGGTMYFIDSTAHSFDAFDYDLDSGTLSNRRVVASIPPE